MRRVWLTILLLLAPLGAMAQDSGCHVLVDGMLIEIAAPLDGADDAPLLERLTTWPGRVWDDAWGAPVPCDSETTIVFLAALEGFTPAEAQMHCLAPLPGDEGYLLVPGQRGFGGICSRTACERVNLAAADVAAVAATALAFVGRDGGPIEGTQRGTGTLLLSGTNLALGQVLEGASTELAMTLASPVGAATLLATGGLLYYCGD